MNQYLKKVRCRLEKKEIKKDVFGFEKAINFEAINNLSIEDLRKLEKVLKNVK
jgi:hypothetical protein